MMEQKTIKRGFGFTAGRVLAVKQDNKIFLFGTSPTDHSRDVRPPAHLEWNQELGCEVWVKDPITGVDDAIPCLPEVWETEQAGWEKVNWSTNV